jgi:hypothetical protein
LHVDTSLHVPAQWQRARRARSPCHVVCHVGRHQAEAARLRSELEAARNSGAADVAAAQDEAASQVAAAEALARR